MGSPHLEAPLLVEPSACVPGAAPGAPRARWRAGLLLIYCASLQLLIYIDRGIIAGLLNFAQVEFGIDHFHSGLLGTIFLAGFMLMSPIAAAVAGQGGAGALRAIGVGLAVWTLSIWACGTASTYAVLLLGRAMAGCGEAALVSLAPPLIDDAAPPGKKSAYLAVFFSSIFLGLGVGFVIAGQASSWADGRVLFLAEGVVMAPLCAVALFCGSNLAPDKESSEGATTEGKRPSCEEPGSFHEAADTHGEPKSSTLAGPVSALDVLRAPVYTLLVLGYCATIFTMGGLAFWAPSYLQKVLGARGAAGDSVLGAITGLTGICGTTLGGVLLDALDGRLGRRRLQAVRLCAVFAALSCPVTAAAVAARSRPLFFASLALGQLLVFASTAPANIAMMEAVGPAQRGLALGLCTLASHALGDLVPPVLVGYIADATGSLIPGMWLLALWLLWSALFWSAALVRTAGEEEEAEVRRRAPARRTLPDSDWSTDSGKSDETKGPEYLPRSDTRERAEKGKERREGHPSKAAIW
mmetsp:Transcript_93318/g.290979  ORF Transcript_93318/g.290979 Transcript_93318/m.290979 type:complete len:525 (+) Transcript_93318:80-1654(+)